MALWRRTAHRTISASSRTTAAFPLELPFGFSRLRYAEPWYFGVCRGMAFVQMFRAQDAVRLTQSPSGGGSGCPAWDFQWFIEKPRVGQRYQLVMRAAYVPVDGPGDAAPVRDQIARLVQEWQPKDGKHVDPLMVFPRRDWSYATPESQGMDPDKLRNAVEYLAHSLAEHGGAETLFIVRNGYAIWQGPECDREFQIFSATKSFTSTLAGLVDR